MLAPNKRRRSFGVPCFVAGKFVPLLYVGRYFLLLSSFDICNRSTYIARSDGRSEKQGENKANLAFEKAVRRRMTDAFDKSAKELSSDRDRDRVARDIIYAI